MRSPVLDASTSTAARGRTISDLINQCSRRTSAGTTSQQRSTLPATGRGTICLQGSQRVPGEGQCSPAGGYQTRVCRMADSLTLIRGVTFRPPDHGPRHGGDVEPGIPITRISYVVFAYATVTGFGYDATGLGSGTDPAAVVGSAGIPGPSGRRRVCSKGERERTRWRLEPLPAMDGLLPGRRPPGSWPGGTGHPPAYSSST